MPAAMASLEPSRRDRISPFLAKPVVSELRRHVRIECFRRRKIGAATIRVPKPQAGEAAAVKRARITRTSGQCRVVIGDRLFEPAELEIREAAAVEGAGVIGREPQGFGAVCKRFLEMAR